MRQHRVGRGWSGSCRGEITRYDTQTTHTILCALHARPRDITLGESRGGRRRRIPLAEGVEGAVLRWMLIDLYRADRRYRNITQQDLRPLWRELRPSVED